MDGDFGFEYTHRQKRTHTQMEDEGSASPTWHSFRRPSFPHEPSNSSPSHPQVSGLHLPRIANMPPSQRPRYPGDGLDFRRPISVSRSNSQTAIIDLTTEDGGPSGSNSRQDRPAPRLPRFAREIIDVDEDDVRPTITVPDSPEIEFISSRPIENARQDSNPRDRRDGHIAVIEEDDIEIVGSNIVPGAHRRERQWNLGAMMLAGVLEDERYPPERFEHLRQRIQRAAHNMRPPVAAPRGRAVGRGHIHIGFIAPTMNFEMVGFDMGLDEGPPPPPPTYDAPAPAPEGYTRAPGETDPMICPNCEEELCVGDSEQKKQVWIVKSCGHVYCGECAANRSTKKSAKGKEKIAPAKHKPFKVCVVEGCDKKTYPPKAMIQVFL